MKSLKKTVKQYFVSLINSFSLKPTEYQYPWEFGPWHGWIAATIYFGLGYLAFQFIESLQNRLFFTLGLFGMAVAMIGLVIGPLIKYAHEKIYNLWEKRCSQKNNDVEPTTKGRTGT